MLSHQRKSIHPEYKKRAFDQEQPDGAVTAQADTAGVVQKAHHDSDALSPADVLQLQRALGNHAVSQLVGGKQPVQRLMALADFKESTSLFARKRRKIKLIDAEITTYEGIAKDNYQARANQLGLIIQECNTYLGYTNKQAKRKAGVQSFLPQAQKEKDIYDHLVLYANAGGRKARFDELIQAQDAANEADTAGYEVDWLYYHTNQKIGDLVTDIRNNEPAVMAQIIQDEVARLQAIINAPNTPDITKAVVTEVLANMGDVNLIEGLPGAKLSNDPSVAEKYTVKHRLEQAGGTAERIGSLAHELTHVSSGESFNNTPLFLLYPPTATAQDITAMAQHRKGEVLALKALYANDPALSAKQKSLISGKLDYAMQNKLPTYAANFFQAGKIDLATKNKMLQVAQAVPENNTLIEYDSVVNQCLIYMQQWNIPQTNAFYAKLMQVAQDAYDARDDARA